MPKNGVYIIFGVVVTLNFDLGNLSVPPTHMMIICGKFH